MSFESCSVDTAVIEDLQGSVYVECHPPDRCPSHSMIVGSHNDAATIMPLIFFKPFQWFAVESGTAYGQTVVR